MIISTTDKWGPHAEEALEDQQIPVTRVGLADIAASPVDWRVPAPAGGDGAAAAEAARSLRTPTRA
jgi:predicted helicase